MMDQDKKKSLLDFWQRKAVERMAEAKRRRNVISSRRSGEISKTAYATSRKSFAGGEVESRSRVSTVGNSLSDRGNSATFGKVKIGGVGFAQRNSSFPQSGFAKGKDVSAGVNKPPTRPLGFSR
jgi:hypothetical protein